MKTLGKILTVIAALLLAIPMTAADRFVNFKHGDLLLNSGNTIGIAMSDKEPKGVAIAVNNLAEDLRKVCGAKVELSSSKATIAVGTIGHSATIDRMVKAGQIDGKLLRGKRETYVITVIGDQLVIAGSDRRGTIYGIYELSRQIGVSPWYDWADVPIAHHDRLFVNKGVYTDGEPAVRYRGLFLNDEAPCLTTWVKNTYGTNYGDHRFYSRVFELILRLKGNYLWPAMWGWAFYADDPENSKTADEMGVIMGTSHHEPMARNHQEWARRRKDYGTWNYATNQATIDKFFREGIERMRGTEDIVTIGMRGDGDDTMDEGTNTKLLEKVVKNQRNIIRQVTGKKASETPQMWALYKEVQDYYDAGMRVPDDVTILLCDDNWGNIRRVPNLKERNHPGGWGMYYHVDYVGAPRNSKWLNVTQTQQMHEQLSLAYDHGIDRLWVLNVGDLKPMEYPITLFLDMAWNPKEYTTPNVTSHTRKFFAENIGEEYADEAARIYNLNCKYMARVTPEMLDRTTYNVETGEWEKVTADYARLEAEALRQFVSLPKEKHDFYCQLLLFPVQAMANLYEMYYAQAMNHYCYEMNNPACNEWADKVAQCFKRDSVLCRQYNKDIAGGKWDGMMIQKHIGYTSWNDAFPADMMPEVFLMDDNKIGGYVFKPSDGYVAMEAEHYYESSCPEGTEWTVYPHYTRTLSGIALTPYTKEAKGASLTYRFTLPKQCPKEVKVIVVTKSTLDFQNKGGMVYDVAIDNGKAVEVNFNKTLVDRQPYMYSDFYPTIARRVVEKTVTLPVNATGDSLHTLTLRPHDPGIVFEKIVIDWGGYKPSYLYMDESPTGK